MYQRAMIAEKGRGGSIGEKHACIHSLLFFPKCQQLVSCVDGGAYSVT